MVRLILGLNDQSNKKKEDLLLLLEIKKIHIYSAFRIQKEIKMFRVGLAQEVEQLSCNRKVAGSIFNSS